MTSRIIKFRALYEGVWYYQTLEEIITITLAAFRNGEHKSQYTGMEDDIGNDIYEGDILRRVGTKDIFIGSYEDKPGANPLKISTEVVELKVTSDQFGTTSFGYSLHRQGTYSERSKAAKYIVIGNIYQNPELLNQKPH